MGRVLRKLRFILVLLIAGVTAAEAAAIDGQVVDAGTGAPIAGANVVVVGADVGASTDSLGRFTLPLTASDGAKLKVTHVQYEPTTIELSRSVVEDSVLVIHLNEKYTEIQGITVTPSRHSLSGLEAPSEQSLTRTQINAVPQLAEDVYRAVTRLPGVATNEFAARFVVRGGDHDEILVLMDGMELYEPFHLKEVDGGALSIVDLGAVRGVDLITGGFPAQYGDYMSGVFNIETRQPPVDEQRAEVGLSMTSARVMTEGRFAGNRGSWLLSARRGYVDFAMGLMNEEYELSPVYYDVLAKGGYAVSERHRVSANVLFSHDDFDFFDEATYETTNAYENLYGWVTLESELSKQLSARTIVSGGQIDELRDGARLYNTGRTAFTVFDRRRFEFRGIKQDYQFAVSSRVLLSGGLDYQHLEARYDYTSVDFNAFPDDTTLIRTTIDGDQFGAYLTGRTRLFDWLTTEVGLRYDRSSYSGDELLSPRVNAVVSPHERVALRAGWGYFYQTQGIDELGVEDGEQQYYAAELAEHRIVGVEYRIPQRLNVRVEAYQKRISDLRPDYRNWLNELLLFPEAELDRTRVLLDGSRSEGVEFSVRHNIGTKISWWLNYALMRSYDNVTSFNHEGLSVLYNTEVPGQFDQPHALNFDISYRPSAPWQLSMSWEYHTGWPYTSRTLIRRGLYDYVIDIGELNAERYPDYHRMDVRVNRYFNVGGGRLTAYLEVHNLYNRKNVRTYEYRVKVSGENVWLERKEWHWLSLLPSVGITWQFDL